MELSREQAERYTRHFVLREIGVSGQKRLFASSVLVIGAGALGSAALQYLAAAGVGTIGIADGDSVEMSNLGRQVIHTAAHIGMRKTDSAACAVRALRPDADIRLYPAHVTPENIRDVIEPYDFILDCTDRFPAKFLINDGCVRSRKPYCHAGAVRFEGQAMTYVPGQSACLRCILGEDAADAPSVTCAEVGVFGAIPGILGCVQATEAVKYLLGIGTLLTGRVLHVDGLRMRMQTVEVGPPRADCPVCGTRGTDIHAKENRSV